MFSAVKQLASIDHEAMLNSICTVQMHSVSLIKVRVILCLDYICIVQDQTENTAHFGII